MGLNNKEGETKLKSIISNVDCYQLKVIIENMLEFDVTKRANLNNL